MITSRNCLTLDVIILDNVSKAFPNKEYDIALSSNSFCNNFFWMLSFFNNIISGRYHFQTL